MNWKGVLDKPRQRYHLYRGGQVVLSSLVLTALILLTRTSSPELALTFYFLFAGPIVVAAYTWGQEAAGVLILAVVSFFVPVALGAVEDANNFTIGALEMAASVVLFGSLAVVGERAGAHRRQRDRYRELDRISERFSRELQVDELLEVILQQTMPLFNAAGGEIVLWDEHLHQFEVAAAVGVSRDAQQYLQRRNYLELAQATPRDADAVLSGRTRRRKTLTEEIIDRNEPFLHNDLEDDPRYVYCDGDTPLIRVRVQSVIAVPLRRGHEAFGLLCLFNRTNGGFKQGDLDFLATIAEKSVITIENARLYRMTDVNLARRVEELSILNRIAHALVSSLDLDQTVQTIIDALQKLFPYALVEVCLWDPVNQVLNTCAWTGDSSYLEATDGVYRLDEGYGGWIARHREQLWVPDIKARIDIRPKIDSPDFTFRS
jgi:GAF domain-containing protein